MATIQSILFNLLINAIPLAIISFPLLFLRKKNTSGKIFRRIYYGIMLFFFIYFVLPVIFQIGDESEMNYTGGGQNMAAGMLYIVSRTFSLIINYFQVPFLNLPFVFIVSPAVSMLFLWNIIRKEGGKGFKKNLAEVTFEIKGSPKEMIMENIKSGDWTEEKQLFKLFVVILPISLYLLSKILTLAGLGIATIQDGSALGWFIEVFFAYLAVFLMGIHLLKSSNASFKGKFVGEKLESDTSASLITVGTPISILSVILFVVEFQDSLLLIIYFFGYFLMAAFIFITYLAFFEPICILILVKIVDKFKIKEEIEEKPKFNITKQTDSMVYVYPIICSLGSILLIILIYGILGTLQTIIAGSEANLSILVAGTNYNATQGLYNAIQLETIQMLSTMGSIGIFLAIGFLLSVTIKNTKKIFHSSGIFLFIILLTTILSIFIPIINLNNLIFDTNIQWITGKLVTTSAFSDEFVVFTLRTAFLNASTENQFLFYLAIPYNFSRYFTDILLWGLMFYYFSQKFFVKMVKREKYVDRTTFSTMVLPPLGPEFVLNNYLITTNPNISIPESERDEIKDIMKNLEKGKLTNELKSDDIEEIKRLFTTLKYLRRNKWIEWWSPEYTFTFERANLDGLYVMYSDGRDVISYKFSDASKTDPALVAGMFSAITSFIKETTKSSDFLRTIDHGDSKITIEYGKYIFGAIFADRETTEIRTNLKNFLIEFERRHGEILSNWNGNCTSFRESHLLVEEKFGIEK